MGTFTYENSDRTNKYEKYEWDQVWIEDTDNTTSTRVLYIGDSISCNVRCLATKQSKEEFLFDGFGTSKSLDNKYFKDSITLFSAQLPKTDIVIFNNGLHGWHLNDTEEYGFYYEDMIKFLIDKFRNIPLFIALTTYIKDDTRLKRVEERNKTATQIAEKYHLPIIDLYSISEKSKDLLSKDKIHFTPEGNEIIAKEIVNILYNKYNTPD